MLRVELRQAKPGMELSLPVTHPSRPDTTLLRAGFVLDAHSIDRLKELGMRNVWIRYPGLEFVCQHISPAIVDAGQRLTAAISETFEASMTHVGAKMDYARYRAAVGHLMDKLASRSKAGLFVVDLAGSEIPMARSAGHGCFLSMLMGMKLDTYLMMSRSRLGTGARDVSSLGMGALLRDVGMLHLSEELQWKWRATWDESDPAWREHVRIGYELVRGHIEPSAAAAVLHHHQRFDGSGFLNRKTYSGELVPYCGEDIHIFARIIAAADLFDRMRYPPADGPGEPEPIPTPTVRVLNRLLRGPESAWLDPIVVRALINVVPAFAPGSMVMLNNGQQCVVVDWKSDDPCRPIVAPMDDAMLDPNRYEPPAEVIDLQKTPELWIEETEHQSVGDDLFFPLFEGELDLSHIQRQLITQPSSSV